MQEVVQLVGPDALPEREQAVLLITKMLREDFLQQNAFSEVDARSNLQKQYLMLKSILKFHERTKGALDLGVPLKKISNLPSTAKIGRMKEIPEKEIEKFEQLHKEIDAEFEEIIKR